MSVLWLASQAFFAPRLTRMAVDEIVRLPLPLFGMSIPILSVRANPSHSDQTLNNGEPVGQFSKSVEGVAVSRDQLALAILQME